MDINRYFSRLRAVREGRLDLLSGEARARLHSQVKALKKASFSAIAPGPDHIETITRDALSEARSCDQLELFEASVGKRLAGQRLLEVGAGIGMTVAVARSWYGAKAIGVEPGNEEYHGTLDISRDLLTACNLPSDLVIPAVGEALPFADRSFDCLVSSNVLEHVQDPPRVLSEAIRVLRPGGYMQIVAPNYGSWWEGHYGLLWIPHMPAALAKIYVRLRGRAPKYVDSLQFLTYRKMERWLRPHAGRIEILSWGRRLWQSRLHNLAFGEYASLGRLKRLVRLIHCLRLILPLQVIGSALKWETPIVLTARRLPEGNLPGD